MTYDGLQAGAPIRVRQDAGGVGCLLQIQGKTGASHLVTAGHLFSRGAEGEVIVAAPAGGSELDVGTLRLNLLDGVPGAAGATLDAALIELTADGVALAAMTPQRAVGPVLNPVQFAGRRALAWLPTNGRPSTIVAVHSQPYSFPAMQSAARGVYAVSRVVRVSAAITTPGDSGTLLAQVGSIGAIGLCIGAVGTAMSLFEPLFRVLPIVERYLARPIRLWPAVNR